MKDLEEVALCYVGNIPPFYHAKHLRMFFSTYVEMKAFHTFHFRHRPERISDRIASISNQNLSKNSKSNCAFIKVFPEYLSKILETYKGRHWLHRNGFDSLHNVCFISEIKSIKDSTLVSERAYLSRKELDRLRKMSGSVLRSANETSMSGLLEFSPPSDMPNGNVGTPTSHFLALIDQCKLSSVVIAKLGLYFPRLRRRGKYSAVPHSYADEDAISATEGELEEQEEESMDVVAANGTALLDDKGYEEYCEQQVERRLAEDEAFRRQKSEMPSDETEEEKDEDKDEDKDDDETEEWDRFEALHDDPHNVDRGKLKVFEEEQEVVWEKGGPGLVFYTDEQVWREGEKLEIFDDPTNYDWDLDMAVWYEKGAGDRDARDLMEIRRDARWEAGIEDPVEAEQFFDKHRENVGVRLMQRMGWQKGGRLGRTERLGLETALEGEGQKASDKTGLGFHGPKLVRRQLGAPSASSAPSGAIGKAPAAENLWRRNDPRDVLKYRPSIAFVAGGMLKPKGLRQPLNVACE